MKRFTALFATLLVAVAAMCSPRVFVLTIDEEIDATAWNHTRRAIEEMRKDGGANLFLVRLNTYGGAVDMADSIRTALMRLNVPTAAYIDNNAASAGALIALACDTVYMAPGATMGAATVVNGQGEPMPVKFQSYWSSVMRATAMAHGKYILPGDSVARWRRNPDLAADMVNPDKAISFTATEAVEAGMADGIAASPGEVLANLGLENAHMEYFQPTVTDGLLGFLASAAVRAVLIMLILGGIYMEMHTPGLGFAAAVSVVAAVLYFLPMIVSGTLAAWVLILFIIGVILLALEIFVIPGFGIAGISGIVAIVVALLGAMVHSDDVSGFDMSALGRSCAVLISGIVLAAGAVWLLTSRFGPKRLRGTLELNHEQKVSHGYIGVDTAPALAIGAFGQAVTDLRPAGKVEVDGTVYDATSTGNFIRHGRRVKVVRYEAAQLYVTEIIPEGK